MSYNACEDGTVSYITERHGIITDVSIAFCEFTNYTPDELLGRTIDDVSRILLRIYADVKYINDEAQTYIFTKLLEAKNVNIRKSRCNESGQTSYIFTEIPVSGIKEKNPFLEKLLADNVTGIGIFSAPGYALIQANQTFLNYLPRPNNTRELAYGKSLNQLIPDFISHCGMIGWKHLVENSQSLYIKEKQGLIAGRGDRYWDNTITPVREKGQFKYLVSMLDDVTRKVLSRDHFTRQTKIIKKQKERAEILWEVAEKLLESVKPQEIVEEICLRVMEFLDCQIFFNYIIDQNNSRLHLNAYAGVADETARELEWLDYGISVCGCTARDGCRTVAENIQGSNDILTEPLRQMGIRAYACHPLMEKNKVIGTLSFGTKSRDRFDDDELALMKAVADQVSVALNRLRTDHVMLKQQQLMINAEREKNEALQEAMEMKDEFISLISHEFKTPLTVINSAIQAMQQICRNELSDKARSFLSKILQNSNRQLKLVNNLLDITRANAGHLKLRKTNIDIVFLTRSITDSIKIFAEQKGIRLSFSSTLQKKVIGTDQEKYERILLNLLSNAVKYTPEGKSIHVRVYQKVINNKCRVYVQVKDKGFGIPDDMTELIFERFGQVDRSLSRQAEGTGIGLYLVKHLIELLDGEIMLNSKVGKGSTFTFHLPVGKVKEIKNEHMIKEISDNRLIQATAIEFSDIYLPS